MARNKVVTMAEESNPDFFNEVPGTWSGGLPHRQQLQQQLIARPGGAQLVSAVALIFNFLSDTIPAPRGPISSQTPCP